MSKWVRKDFEIKGRFSGSRLKGRENEFLYEIYWNGKRVGDKCFSRKADAEKWLRGFIKIANALRAERGLL